MIGRTNAGSDGMGKSTLVVQAETGSTVTVTKGSETRSAPEKYGVWAFPGLAAGSWTVKAVKSGKTATKTVTMDGTHSVTVTLVFNVIPAFTYTGDYALEDDNGNPITSTTGNWRLRLLTSGTLKITELRGAENGVDVFLVGGGGSGGGYLNGVDRECGSGGGGGYTTTERNMTLTATTYDIQVGSGGAPIDGHNAGIAGGVTSAFGLTANGGSGGTKGYKGGDGGSGGGSGGYYTNNAGGNGGSDGGNGAKTRNDGGTGQGTTTREFGESSGVLYAGGGGGGAYTLAPGAGGAGGGGKGSSNNSLDVGNGVANSGGGGGGARNGGASSGAGGSGIVIIRNKR